MAPPVYNVIRFSRYPMTIYSLPVRIFLTFVLPFAWVAFYPATWFVGGPDLKLVALLTPLVGVIVFGGAVLIWRAACATTRAPAAEQPKARKSCTGSQHRSLAAAARRLCLLVLAAAARGGPDLVRRERRDPFLLRAGPSCSRC